MKILIVSATTLEVQPTLDYLEINGIKLDFFTYSIKNHIIYTLVTGVGALNTAFSISRFQYLKNIDLAINIGIAGSYKIDFPILSIVQVQKDRFADLGVEESDGSFKDVYEMALCNGQQYPYNDGWLASKIHDSFFTNLPNAIGITLNTSKGTQKSICQMISKYNPDIESMEGAGFIYACSMFDIPSIQIRAISNNVEPRNKSNWKVSEAIKCLNEKLVQLILDN